jgi:hypothetical protein
MGEVASRRIGIVYYQRKTLGLFRYSIYFQCWIDVLSVTSEAFWDVSAFAEIRSAKFHRCLLWNFRSGCAGHQTQCKHQDWKKSFHGSLVSYNRTIFFGGHQTNIYLLKASSSIQVARHVPYFANPQHFSHPRNSPKKLMLSAPRKRLMVLPLAIKKPGLRAGLFALSGL